MPDVAGIFDAQAAIKALDAEYWQRAMEMTDVLNFMPARRRQEWHDQIDALDTPPFEESHVRDNIERLMARRMDFLSEMVEGIFLALSGEYVTNRPEGFSKRMIVAGCYGEFGITGRNADYLHDMRVIMARLMQRGDLTRVSTINLLERVRRDTGQWFPVDGGAFRIRVYKKGTAHVEVNPDIARHLNQILAHRNPGAIPAGFRRKPAKGKARPNKTPELVDNPIPFPVLRWLDGEKLYWRDDQQYHLHLSVNFCNADKHIKARVTRLIQSIGGIPDGSCAFTFDYDANPILKEMLISGAVPDHKSYQYYPTPDTIAAEVVAQAGIKAGDWCLEPSAGQGALVEHMPANNTICVEQSRLNAMARLVNYVWNGVNELSELAIREQGVAGLGMRRWTCSACGVTHDRDVNAAQNIVALGHERPAEGVPSL